MTGARSRRKGNRAERAAVDYLRAHGFPHAERKGAGLAGSDVAELGPGLEIEIKDHARFELRKWLDQLSDAMDDTDAAMGVVIVKRAQTMDVARWWWVQPLWMLETMHTLARQNHPGRFNGLHVEHVNKGVSSSERTVDKFGAVVTHAGTHRIPVLAVPEHPGADREWAVGVTTVGRGLPLLRAAGYGDPLETT